MHSIPFTISAVTESIRAAKNGSNITFVVAAIWEFTFEAHSEENQRALVRLQANKLDLALGQCQSNRPRMMETCSLLIWGQTHMHTSGRDEPITQ